MSEQQKTAEEQLNEAVWTWAGRIAIAAVLIGAGWFGAYTQYGDAADLRVQVETHQDRILDLENQRETMSTRLAKQTRDKEVCEKDRKALKQELKGR